MGACAAHAIVVDSRKTTPLTGDVFQRADPHVTFIDSTTFDTTALTFRGVKGMVRCAFDPKAFFRSRWFRPGDLVVYAEAALLGVKSYPGWYSDITERVPVMVGVNVPTFRLLDVLSVEFEYYRNPYWNATEFIWKEHTPRPYTGSSRVLGFYSDWERKTDDDFRWSIYGSRKIGSFMRVSAQAASDHLFRSPAYTPAGLPKYTEICQRTSDWYYMFRVAFMF